MSDSGPSFKTSRLLQRIKAAIDEHAPFTGKLHVSVVNEPKREKSKSGYEVLVRWACWNLEKGGYEVTQPEFEVLSDSVT